MSDTLSTRGAPAEWLGETQPMQVAIQGGLESSPVFGWQTLPLVVGSIYVDTTRPLEEDA